jgi:hypothetical protein
MIKRKNKKPRVKGKYIANGHTFESYENVLEYCYENDFRVTGTNTVSGNYIIDLASKN